MILLYQGRFSDNGNCIIRSLVFAVVLLIEVDIFFLCHISTTLKVGARAKEIGSDNALG